MRSKTDKFGQPYFEGVGSHCSNYTFDYHVHGPWRKNYLQLFRILHQFVENKNGKFLDVGCGKGFILHFADEFGYKTYGIDVSEFAIKEAGKNKYTKAKLFCQDVQKRFPFPENFFDVVISSEVVEHLEHPEKTFKEIFRVLKPDGIFLFTTPNKHSFRRMLGIFSKRFRDKDITHINVQAKRKWLQLVKSSGNFKVEKIIMQHIVGKERVQQLLKFDVDKAFPFGHDGFVFVLRKSREP